MSQSQTSNKSRSRGLLLAAVAVITALLTTGTTVAVATASPSTAPSHTATHIEFKKKKKKKKPKPKPKPKPKTTTTTAPSTTPTTNETPPSGTTVVSEDGSSLLLPLFQLWATGYHKQYANMYITPAGGGSGKGITDATAGVVEIGASDAYLSSTEVSSAPGLKNIALAISAQMVNYNIPGLSSSVHLKLTGPVLAQIYEGKITQWNDSAITSLNPGVVIPSDKIVALHRSDSSGDTFIFSSFLSSSDPNSWGSSIGYGTSISFPSIPNALGESGNGGMVTGCNNTPGCIAYIGISYYSETQSNGLGEAQLSNASGNFELPTPATITAEAQALEAKTPANETLSMIYDSAAAGYPIINYEYAIIPGSESNTNAAQAVRAFLYWAVDPNGGSASSYLSQVNFQPLTAKVRALSQAQIAEISG
jgi:phosphate transport system substrate-binding protein